jgi:hypothetical protein
LFASIGPTFAAIGDWKSRRPGGRTPIGGIARAGFAEWIIGSSRLECLDYVIVLGEANLRPHSKIISRLLQLRQNTSVPAQGCADFRPIQQIEIIRSHPILGSLSRSLRPDLIFR